MQTHQMMILFTKPKSFSFETIPNNRFTEVNGKEIEPI